MHNMLKSNHDTAVDELKEIMPTSKPEVPGKQSTPLPQLKLQTEAALDIIKLPTKTAKPPGSKSNDQGLLTKGKGKGRGRQKFEVPVTGKKSTPSPQLKSQTVAALHHKSQTKNIIKLFKAAKPPGSKSNDQSHQKLDVPEWTIVKGSKE